MGGYHHHDGQSVDEDDRHHVVQSTYVVIAGSTCVLNDADPRAVVQAWLNTYLQSAVRVKGISETEVGVILNVYFYLQNELRPVSLPLPQAISNKPIDCHAS